MTGDGAGHPRPSAATPAPQRRARTRAAVVLATLALTGSFALARPGARAQTTPRLELVLVDQTVEFGPDGDLRFVYEVRGDLDAAGITPPTTTTTTTTTTASTTTVLDGAAPPPVSAPPPEPPPPVPLTIEVTNHGAIDDPRLLAAAIGPSPTTSVLPDVIDGVAIEDGRALLRFEPTDDGDATRALLTVEVGTDRGIDTSVADRLRFDDPGTYPVVVDLVVDGTTAASHGTVVERVGDPPARVPAIDVGVLGSVDDPGPDPDPIELRRAVAAFTDLIEMAAELPAPVTLSVPPGVVAAAAADPDDAARIADALADDELLVRPLVDFDVSAAAAADRADAFVAQLTAGEELLLDTLPGVAVRRDVWVATDPVSADGAQVLRDAGVRLLVMPPDAFDELDGGTPERTDRFVEFPLPGGGTMPVISIDESAERLTGPPEDELGDWTTFEWTIAATTELRLDQREDGIAVDRSRVMAADDLGAFDPTLLSTLEASGSDVLRFTTVSNLRGVTDGVPADGEFPDTAGPDLTDRVERIEAAKLEMTSAASMLDPDDPRPIEWSRSLDQLVATGYPDDVVDAAVDDLVAESRRIRDAVVPPEPFTFTLTGNRGDIELRVGNELDEPIRVLLQMSSPRLRFPNGDEVVELRPGVTVVRIPVEARSNGTSSVQVQISTPLGEALAEPVELTSRVTALTGLGPLLTVGFLLVLLSWWFSHWRNKRADEDALDGDEPDTTQPDTTQPDTTQPDTADATADGGAGQPRDLVPAEDADDRRRSRPEGGANLSDP